MTVMVCHVMTWNEFYELIDTLDVRMWRNFLISMFRFIFRAFWIETTQIDFFAFGTFLKSSRHWNSGLDTWHTAGTCRLVIWSWISLMMNTWTIRLLISQYQGSGCQISCRTSTWRMICGAVPRTDWSAVRHSILNVWKRDCEWNLPWIIIRIVLQCILIYCNVLQCIVMVTWG